MRTWSAKRIWARVYEALMVLTRSKRKTMSDAANDGSSVAAQADSPGIANAPQPTPSVSDRCVSKRQITTCCWTAGRAASSSSNRVADISPVGLNPLSQDSKTSTKSSKAKKLVIEPTKGTTASRDRRTSTKSISTSQNDAPIHKSVSKRNYTLSSTKTNDASKNDEHHKNEVMGNEDHLTETVSFSSKEDPSNIGDINCEGSGSDVQADPARGNNVVEQVAATTNYQVTQSRVAGSSCTTDQVTQSVSNIVKTCQSDSNPAARFSTRLSNKKTSETPSTTVSPVTQCKVFRSGCTTNQAARPVSDSLAREGQSDPNPVASTSTRLSTRSRRNKASAISLPTKVSPNILNQGCLKNFTGCRKNEGSLTLPPATAALVHDTHKVHSSNTCQADPNAVAKMSTRSSKNKALVIRPPTAVPVSPVIEPPFRIPAKGKRSAPSDGERKSDADVIKSPPKKGHTECTNKQNDVSEKDKRKHNVTKKKNSHDTDAPKSQALNKDSAPSSSKQKPIYHIKCKDPFSEPSPLEPIGEKCQLCGIDLAFTLISSDSHSEDFPFSAVLSCGHAFHDSCLNDIFGPEEPPCMRCLEAEI